MRRCWLLPRSIHAKVGNKQLVNRNILLIKKIIVAETVGGRTKALPLSEWAVAFPRHPLPTQTAHSANSKTNGCPLPRLAQLSLSDHTASLSRQLLPQCLKRNILQLLKLNLPQLPNLANPLQQTPSFTRSAPAETCRQLPKFTLLPLMPLLSLLLLP